MKPADEKIIKDNLVDICRSLGEGRAFGVGGLFIAAPGNPFVCDVLSIAADALDATKTMEHETS